MTLEEAIKLTESELWDLEREKVWDANTGGKFECHRTLDLLVTIRAALLAQLSADPDRLERFMNDRLLDAIERYLRQEVYRPANAPTLVRLDNDDD